MPKGMQKRRNPDGFRLFLIAVLRMPIMQQDAWLLQALYQLVVFPSMSEFDKKDFLICAFNEIMGFSYLPDKVMSNRNEMKKELEKDHTQRINRLTEKCGSKAFCSLGSFEKDMMLEFGRAPQISPIEFTNLLNEVFGTVKIGDPVM